MYCYQSEGNFDLWSGLPSGKGWNLWKLEENSLFNFI